MSELLKKQNYGVEVEFTGISRKMAADAVAEIIGTTASRPDHTCYQTRTIQDSQGRKWKVMRDSSIHPIRKVGTENMDEYRVEFVTPVLKYEDLDTLQAIIRKFREIGGVPHSSCGIHIHVDGANHTATSLRRLVNFMYSRQEIIYDALAVGDRKYRWCQPVCKNLLDTMKKDKNITTDSVEKIWYSPANDGYCGGINHQHYNSTRYHALNLHSFFQKGTVEFRLFNSTLHAGKIKAYVQFCLALSAWSIESDDKVVFRSMNGYTARNASGSPIYCIFSSSPMLALFIMDLSTTIFSTPNNCASTFSVTDAGFAVLPPYLTLSRTPGCTFRALNTLIPRPRRFGIRPVC